MDTEHFHLWVREKDFWLGGADVYRRHLADEAVMVFPGMVLTRQATIESIEKAPRWANVTFDEQRIVPLTTDAVALLYRAKASKSGQEGDYLALVSSTYVRVGDAWKLALHQQSPARGGS